MFRAVGQNGFAEHVLAHETSAGERQTDVQLGEVEQHIVGRAAGALMLAANVGQRFTGGKGVNDLDLVNDPVAAGEDASAGRFAGLGFHRLSHGRDGFT